MPAKALGHDAAALREKFFALSKEDRIAAGLHLIQTWGEDERKTVFEVAEACEVPVTTCFERWARSDFEAALERAEQWDGFSDNLLRQAVILAVAKSDPVEAARRMRARLDPMSRTYYYYVMLQGLVPALGDQPALVILQALHEMRSDLYFMDDFRFGDATETLVNQNKPWNPTDPSREWAYLMAQPPSLARDHLLCATMRAWLKKDLEKAVTVQLPHLYGDMMRYRLEGSFPNDLEKARDLLPVANFDFIRSWLRQVTRRGPSPEYHQWAALSVPEAASPEKSRALDTVMRLWLEKDEAAATAWAQQLPAGPARDAALEACVESEIHHLIPEDWHRAFTMAKAMPPGERSIRCLKAVFAAAGSEEFVFVQKHLAGQAISGSEKAAVRDAWRLARSMFLQQRGDNMAAYIILLEIEDPVLRRWNAEDSLSFVQFTQMDVVRDLIEKSAMSREDKDACVTQMILLAMDGGGPKGPDLQGRLKVSMDITDPETRFVHQRSVLHEVAENDLEKARTLIEEAPIKEEDKVRLRKDWERISKWERREKEKSAK
ncbi:MAG TPA: hypothetical protein VLE43_03385 [Candidatus Saccharimonadia bacterium]|nr:hypothetical protein [Candidatus Saccharimonadia bacterium]